MSKHKEPAELARDTLKLLGERGLSPTPEHYASVFQELGGGKEAKAASSAPNWSALIRDLLRQLEMTHKGVTLTRKKEGLEVVLNRFGSKPEVMSEKLTGLMRSWGSGSAAPDLSPAVLPEATPAEATAISAPTAAPAKSADKADGNDLLQQLRELLAQSLEHSLPSQPELADDIKRLVVVVRATDNPTKVNDLTKQLRQFWLKLELRGGDKVKIQEGLLRLLRLLVENVSELVADDEWMQGQVSALQTIISQPMDKHAIADAERNLRDAIIKQSSLKQSLTDAKTTLKSLMTTFIDRLGNLTESTGEYHQKIEGYSQQISKADDLTLLSHILDDVMHDTRIIQASALRSHEELLNTKKQADEAEARIKQLEEELMQVSELVREDQLTGALNRRGLDETLDRELKRADRNKTLLCVALLDIDNFKKLNDSLGHQAGDRALTHLTQVIKDTLRPSDAVGRYGGEEFVIILPDTDINAGVEAVQRLQRDLTKKFFLHNNERILVTFSAGVALRGEEEDQEDLLGRADKAMYQAKQTGKNRVVSAG
ncbi:MAG: diguanylate cyclase [Gammaproteobacteria bacterium]|nr:diguanylate cyclase [Gammaproteobacteria bacterium]MBU1623767.1 diguanylate cyclase [Gammaproteobacteria bacterium]